MTKSFGSVDNENELNSLKMKLEKVKGYVDFIQHNPDPSHVLRSPLVSVKSFLSILEISNYNMDPQELKELAESVNQSVEKLLSTIDTFFKAQ